MRKTLKRKLTGSMMLAVTAAMAIVSVCLLLGMTRYYSVQFVEQVSGVFTTELIAEMNEESAVSEETAVSSIQQTMEAYAGRLGIGSGREYSIWDGETGEYLGGSQENASATDNVITAMNGTVGSAIPLFASKMDVAIPISGDISLVIDIQDDGSNMRQRIWNIFLLLLAGLAVSLVMCLLLSWMMADAFTASVMQAAKTVRKDIQKSGLPTGDWEALALALCEPKKHRSRNADKSGAQADAVPMISAYLSEGLIQFTANGHITQMNVAAQSMLGVSFDGDLPFERAFPGVPIPDDTQRMVHGQFVHDGVRLDVVFIALDTGAFAGVLRPIEEEQL